MLGTGVRLFDKMDQSKFTFDIIDVINSPIVTHLRYKVNNK
jgi:hypothetical protein